jgi:hypothetical protein
MTRAFELNRHLPAVSYHGVGAKRPASAAALRGRFHICYTGWPELGMRSDRFNPTKYGKNEY